MVNNKVVAKRWQTFAKSNNFVAMTDKPFKPAYLQKPADNSLQKKWFACFWIWSESQNKLVRKRLIVKGKTIKERLQAAEDIVTELNTMLEQGFITDPVSKKKTLQEKDITLIEAIDAFNARKKITLKNRSAGTYMSCGRTFCEFLASEGLQSITPKTFTVEMAYKYLDWVVMTKKLSNKSHNKHKGYMSSVFNELRRRELVVVNPFANVPKLVEVIGRYRLFSPEQIEMVKEATTNDEPMWFFVNFIYYTFMRPHEEARLVKIEDIKAASIIVKAQNAKRSRVRHVQIPPGLEAFLTKHKVRDYPSHYYLFGKDALPSEKPVYPKYWYLRHKKYMVQLGLFGKDFDLYGWKHTGAAALYRATKDLKLVQEQCGHSDPKQTAQYLRDLGAFYYEGQIQAFPSI